MERRKEFKISRKTKYREIWGNWVWFFHQTMPAFLYVAASCYILRLDNSLFHLRSTNFCTTLLRKDNIAYHRIIEYAEFEEILRVLAPRDHSKFNPCVWKHCPNIPGTLAVWAMPIACSRAPLPLVKNISLIPIWPPSNTAPCLLL